MSGKKRELSKLEQYAKRMEKYNPGERWQEFFGMVVGYIILVIGWVILCLIGFRPFDMVMHITVLGFLFCYECYSGWMITNIYLKVGNISRKERQAISWVVCYMPLEWEEYYRVIWKKILNYVKGMEALWFVLNILTVLIANMESETIQGDSVIEVAWPKTWDQTGYVLISWIAGAVLMIAGFFIGFCLARVFEKRRQKYILENNREKVQWEKTKEVKSDNKQYMKYKVICCVVIIIVHCCFFVQIIGRNQLLTDVIAYRRISFLSCVCMCLMYGVPYQCVDSFVAAVEQIRRKGKVDWWRLVMPFLVVGLLAYIEVTGSVTFYEEHTEAKAGFVEMSYDYKDATGYEVHTSFGSPQLTLQFGFCRIKLFGLYGDYSEAFWDADMSEGHRDIKYIAYLVEKLDAAGVPGKISNREELEQEVKEVAEGLEDEETMQAWQKILECVE